MHDYSHELYNIIFETINNVLKHASARNGWISISTFNQKLAVAVKEDGMGFVVERQMGGFGLKSINLRIEKLRGSCKMEST